MIPNNIATFRERLKLSKQKLSEKTGISPSNLYQIEAGRIYPYPGWRKRIAEALSTTEEDLFPGVDDIKEKEHA